MNALRSTMISSSAFLRESAAEMVELILLDGGDCEGLTKVFVALWLDDRYRVTLDCSQLDSLGTNEVRTLIRFAVQFAHHGGFVRLTHASARIRALLEVFRCGKLLAPARSGDDSSVRG